MPRRPKPPQPEYAFLAIAVEGYTARTEVGINLALHGTCTAPQGRSGERYEVTLVGTSATPRALRLRVKDLHQRDKNGMPQYRPYRGASRPVYAEPPGLAFLDKVRGEHRWTVWMQVAPRMVTDSLLLLGGGKQVYLLIHEKKAHRQRQVRSLAVQTTDPAEE